ncbi:MAG: DUF2330 domain-containing protein [Myxococcales bacterium]|nr:DUF2330 domain-containing protein [Myxococcales bacterium]
MRTRYALLFTMSLATAALAYSPDASACGGCFPPPPPPGQSQSIVTDHRMILSVSQSQTTLYDQIQFQGNPAEFAWVLPISGTVEIGLSSDVVFNTLHTVTQSTVVEPPRNCPPPPNCNFGGSSSSGGSGSLDSAGSAADPQAPPPVDILKRETVGPYETVQLASTDPNALTDWLNTNGYQIPTDIQPVIGQYVTEKFNFLALKLRPGAGVNSMRPVRVTTTGAGATLPLRMVAAGTGAQVGIALWIVGEGRYEPQNFPTFQITSDDLTWDWAAGTSDFKQLRADKAAPLAGKGWEIESSIAINENQFQNWIIGADRQGGTPSYAPQTDAQGRVIKSAEQVRQEDLQALFANMQSTRVTRVRADLSRAALATDLVVHAPPGQEVLPNTRQPKKELGQPTCPVYDPNTCQQTGTAPRDQAVAQAASASNRGESFSCSTSAGHTSLGLYATCASLAGVLGLALVRSRRRRRSDGPAR